MNQGAPKAARPRPLEETSRTKATALLLCHWLGPYQASAKPLDERIVQTMCGTDNAVVCATRERSLYSLYMSLKLVKGDELMNLDDAKKTLIFHGPGLPFEEWQGRRDANSFIGVLRPYTGIQEEHFFEIMHALFVFAPNLCKQSNVDREVVYALWQICDTAKSLTRGPHDSQIHGRNFISSN